MRLFVSKEDYIECNNSIIYHIYYFLNISLYLFLSNVPNFYIYYKYTIGVWKLHSRIFRLIKIFSALKFASIGILVKFGLKYIN